MHNSVTGPPGPPGPPMRIRSAPDAVAAVPYLLGFHPEASLVAIGYSGPQETCALRMDLPLADPVRGADPVEVAELAARISRPLVDNGFKEVLLMGYGTGREVVPAVAAARLRLSRHGVAVREALRVHEGRWWSLTCPNSACCPPEGTPFDVSTSVVAAQATLAGQVALASRSELARTVAPVTGPARRSMRRATARAQERHRDLIAIAGESGGLPGRMLAEAMPLVTTLPERASHGDRPTDDELAWLGVLLTELRVRDEALIRIDPDRPAPYIACWRDAMRRVEERYTAAPACLLAYAAYTSGDGSLANLALDRAFSADPGYSLTALLRQIIHAGIPPAKARLRMTPEDLARAYNDPPPGNPPP